VASCIAGARARSVRALHEIAPLYGSERWRVSACAADRGSLPLKQFILDSDKKTGGFFKIEGKDYHYLVNVRRLQAGDELNALVCGAREKLVVHAIEREARFCLLKPVQTQAESAEGVFFTERALPPIILFQALPNKGAKMDLIVRQAAECELARIVPFVSERAVRRNCPPERGERIIREARQQSGSAVSTILHPVLGMSEALALWEDVQSAHQAPLGLLFQAPTELGSDEGLEHCPLPLHSCLTGKVDVIALAVGPEGGFSGQEARGFIARGFKTVSLGRTVLRVETAALAAIAAIRIMLLEKDSWILCAKE
jgi:16S rRNA (uracil1498-N3)-methyltransferase